MEDKSDKIIGLIGKLWAEMRAGFGNLQTVITTIRSDMGTMQSSMETMRSDIGKTQSDVGSLRGEVNALGVRTRRLETTLDRVLLKTISIETVVNDHTPRLERLERNWKSIGEDIHEFAGRIKAHDDELTAHASAHRRYEARFEELV